MRFLTRAREVVKLKDGNNTYSGSEIDKHICLHILGEKIMKSLDRIILALGDDKQNK